MRTALVSRRLLGLCLLAVTATATAQLNDPCGCNAGLVPELTRFDASTKFDLMFIKQIDERQFEEIKKSAKMSGTLLELISGSANYAEFDRKRSAKKEITELKVSLDQAQSLLFTTVKTLDWGLCKKHCIQAQKGFFCAVSEMTQATVAVSCSWRPEGPADTRRVDIMTDKKKRRHEEVDPNTTKDWHFDRNPRADLLLTLTPRRGSSQTLKIVATPASPVVNPAKPTLADRIRTGSPCIVNLKGGLGSLVGNSDYTMRYTEAGNQFAVTGHHNRAKQTLTHIYSNASLTRNEVTIWGALMTFAEDGVLRSVPLPDHPGGTIKCTQ